MKLIQSLVLVLVAVLVLDVQAASDKPLLIPQPKSVRYQEGTFDLESGTKWQLRAPTRDERLWTAAQEVFGAKGSFKKSKDDFVVIETGSVSKRVPMPQNAAAWMTNSEGYRLTVDAKGARIVSSTPAGAFYGLQTFSQLAGKPARQRTIPAVEIEDWPSLKFRGAHFFPSASGAPMHQKLIANVLGSLKYNHAIIQCEAAKWDSQPKIAAPNSISKADLRKQVDLCRMNFIEPIPLLNVPGHAEWIFRNGQNAEFAEDQNIHYAYCVNHPKSFEFITNVMTETIEVFRPKYFHIGHDEIAMRGRFPNPECPRCSGKTMTELMTGHANRLNAWLGERNMQSMIWGDMLLAPGEARDATHAKTTADAAERRKVLSKNIIITDWHYAGGADRSSLDLLHKSGFTTIAATWHNPANVANFTRAAEAANSEGLLQTTWMGYFPDERALKSALDQFAAFVLAAEYAWSGRAEAPAQLGYDAKEVFLKLYD